jgi:hypothetical protein
MPVIDGAELDLMDGRRLVETMAFVDRRYLGVIATNGGASIYYASLMIKAWDDPIPEAGLPASRIWKPHTLAHAMTDSLADARAIVLAAYEALVDRLGAQ